MLAGAASIIDGMASIGGALLDRRPSQRMRRTLRDLKRSDAERLRRDWGMIIPLPPGNGPGGRKPD
jgi:hypothetical protein